MSKVAQEQTDFSFEISFCESILKRRPVFPEIMEMLAGFYTKAGRIEQGLALDKQLVASSPANAVYHYNYACSLALVGDAKAAIDSLNTAIELGYEDFGWMLKDPDLKSLHHLPEFQNLLT